MKIEKDSIEKIVEIPAHKRTLTTITAVLDGESKTFKGQKDLAIFLAAQELNLPIEQVQVISKKIATLTSLINRSLRLNLNSKTLDKFRLKQIHRVEETKVDEEDLEKAV